MMIDSHGRPHDDRGRYGTNRDLRWFLGGVRATITQLAAALRMPAEELWAILSRWNNRQGPRAA